MPFSTGSHGRRHLCRPVLRVKRRHGTDTCNPSTECSTNDYGERSLRFNDETRLASKKRDSDGCRHTAPFVHLIDNSFTGTERQPSVHKVEDALLTLRSSYSLQTLLER
ncbi:hypothetical protein J6590_008298 [Homalodisca vitripennis]|nr:hypothetical protein J6590_008298 [Homalodisca vitripennis]